MTLRYTAGRSDDDEGVQSKMFFWLSVISTFVYTLCEWTRTKVNSSE